MSSSFKFDAKKILEKTNGGLDAILHLYPEADKKGGRYPKIRLNFENDNTPSTQINPKSVGTETVFIKSFSSGRSFNCFELVQEEHSLDFYEACKWIANSLSLDMGDKTNFGKGGFEMIEAVEGQKEGDYIFDYKKELTKNELKTLGALITNDHCEKYNLKSCKQFIQVKHYPKDLKEHKTSKTHKYAGKTMQIITKSSDTYPIFVFDFGRWQKIYQPLNQDKSYRFRYVGEKPDNYIFGLDLLESQFILNKKEVQKKIAQADKDNKKLNEKEKDPRLDNVIIGSGDRDSLNIYSMGFNTVWLNSETADLDYKTKVKLFKMAKNVSYCGDIDETGVEQTINLAKTHIDIKIIWLPGKLKEHKYRGKPRKDVKDLMDIMFDPNNPDSIKKYFTKLVFNALPAKFWYQYETKSGTKYDVSNEAMIRFLYYHGFQRLKKENSKTDEYEFVRQIDNVIYDSDSTTLQNFPISWLNEKLFPIPLIDSMHRTAQLSKDKLKRLPLVEPRYKHTGSDFQYQFYQNKIWKITPDEIQQIAYGKAEIDVHEDRIVKRNALIQKNKFFKIFTNDDGLIDIKILRTDNDFLNFMINTSRLHWAETGLKPYQQQILKLVQDGYEGDDLKQRKQAVIDEMKEFRQKHQFQISEPGLTDEQNYEQRLSLINKIYAYGFMLHRHKEDSKSFAPFVMDNKISDNATDSNGGSGKSLLFTKALEKAVGFENIEEIDGSKPDIHKDKFIFDNVDKHKHAVVLNDIQSWFPMRLVYNAITNGFSVEVKAVTKFRMSNEESPKLCILSNFGLADLENSGSTRRRLFVVPFSDYYHEKTRDDLDRWEPKDDFGKQFFQDWNTKDWDDFFNLNAQCIQFVMNQDKPVRAKSDNITKRNQQSAMGTFQFWADQYFTIENLNSFIPTKEVKESYSKENSKTSTQKFNEKMQAWCDFKGFTYNPEEFKTGDYIRKKVNNTTQTCIYVKTPKSYLDQYEANQADLSDAEDEGNDELPFYDPDDKPNLDYDN